MSRAEFHQQHALNAQQQARQLLAQRNILGTKWLDWVARELYTLTPSHYANMVRRELEQLVKATHGNNL